MARIGSSCVDRHEAHLVVDYAGTEMLHPHYERPPTDRAFAARSKPGMFPQAYISRVEADTACRSAGKRLCALTEWLRACRGTHGAVYPYGPREVRGSCNTGKPHLLSAYFGTDPRSWQYHDHFNDPRLDQEPGFLARTGEYAGCVNRLGVHDMVGNLHEWVSDPVDSSLPGKVPLVEAVRNKLDRNFGHGVFMGGFFSTSREHGPGCEFVTIGHEPTYHDYSTGFRCCRDAAVPPTPTSGLAAQHSERK